MKTLHTIATLGVGLGLALPAHADLSSNLVAYWTFNDCNGVDATGRGHDLTFAGTRPDACVDGPKGKGLAFPFNGTDDRWWTVGSADFAVEKAVTYSAWINPARYEGTVVRKYINPNYGYEDKYVYLRGDGYIEFNLLGCFGTAMQSADVIPLDKWTHVAATYDGNYARIYINGRPSGLRETNHDCDVSDSGNNFTVGFSDYFGGPALYFQGGIDDVRVYQRTLTDSEIKQLYNQSIPVRIAGTAPWQTEHTVTCKNVTQGTEYILPASKRDDWACESRNLKFAPGDTVQVIIDGTRK